MDETAYVVLHAAKKDKLIHIRNPKGRAGGMGERGTSEKPRSSLEGASREPQVSGFLVESGTYIQ
jgi:hypothetical protein